MVYPYDNNMDNNETENSEENIITVSELNYVKNTKIYGDAIRETSIAGTDRNSWKGEDSSFAALKRPFIIRGGCSWDSDHAGIFYFFRNEGNNPSSLGGGFRPVVIPVS